MRTAVLVCGVLALLAVAGVRAAASDDEGVVGEAAAQEQAGGAEGEAVTVKKVLGTGGSEVVELGSSAVADEGVHDWVDVVGRDLPVLVEFYLPSCGHCQGFAPEYERVAKAFHSQPVIVARIDANRWTSISDHYRVKSVPDLRFFPAGSTSDQPYIRSRIATDIVGFLNTYAGTKVVFDYSFRQQHGGAAEVVDEGTCPVVRASLLEADAQADAEADAEDALDAAEEEAADAEDAVEDADEAADEAEEVAEANSDEALEDAAMEAEAEADAHETEADIAEEAELEGETEADAEAAEAEADV